VGDRYQSLADRFVPRVNKKAWITDRSLSGAELARDLQARFDLDPGRWQRLLWHRGLYVDKKRIIDALPEEVAAGTLVLAYPFTREPEPVPIGPETVLARRGGLVVVDKPPWLTIQATRATVRLSLELRLRELLRADWITPVHRLDRQTSGVMLFALDSDTARGMHMQFERRSVRKTYLAWVSPVPRERCWTVTGYIRQEEHPRHAYFSLHEDAVDGGRPSETRFETLEVCGEYALLAARPTTGRTHQIRVHLQWGGTPIVADALYGGRDSGGVEAERMMLHAHRLEVTLPGGELATFIAEPPRDFAAFCAGLRGLASADNPC
jgi:RluA family pseudouridine synthase